jgi:tetratricopeptide (TPR) repeat protein/tRNA A-37 threonylcarbamoyl transferase component Bud32
VGRGGMGVVYKARQRSLDRIVAVKMLLSEAFANEAMVTRLKVEADAVARLNHPNIVTIYEVGEHRGHHYFSMAYVKGKSLAQLAREQAISPREIARHVELIARAVHYAHTRGVIHRDLKPSNVMVDESGRPWVTDFGLAKREGVNLKLTVTGQVLGSPGYMAPEQAAGNAAAVDPRSDVYGLGAVLYFLLTGRPPFQGRSTASILRQVLRSDPVSPRLLNPGVPSGLEAICLVCLRKNPGSRYESAEALAEDLKHWLDGEAITAQASSPLESAWRVLSEPRTAWTIGAAMVTIGILNLCFRLVWILGSFLLGSYHASDLSLDEIGSLWAGVSLIAGGVLCWEYGRAMGPAQGLRPEAASSVLVAEATEEINPRRSFRAALSPRLPNWQIAFCLVGFLAWVSCAYLLVQRLNWSSRSLHARTRAKLEQRSNSRIAQTLALARARLEAGHPDEAVPLFEECLRESQLRLGLSHTNTLAVMAWLAYAHESGGRLSNALPLMEQCLELARANLGPTHDHTLSCMQNLGRVYLKAGSTNEGLLLFEELVSARKAKSGPDHTNTLNSMAWLAFAYQSVGRPIDALPLLEHCVTGSQREFGVTRPETLSDVGKLATGYLRAGLTHQAVPVLEELVNGWKANVGPTHTKSLDAGVRLARAYQAVGRLDDALALLNSGVNAAISNRTSDHPISPGSVARPPPRGQGPARLPPKPRPPVVPSTPARNDADADLAETFSCMRNLAFGYRASGRLDSALTVFEAIAEGRRRAGLPESPAVASSLTDLGRCLLAEKMYYAGEAPLRAALAIWERKHPDGWQAYEARSLVGMTLLGQASYEEAETLLLEGYEGLLQRAASIPASSRQHVTKDAAQGLIRLYRVWGKPEQVRMWKGKMADLEAGKTQTNVSQEGWKP